MKLSLKVMAAAFFSGIKGLMAFAQIFISNGVWVHHGYVYLNTLVLQLVCSYLGSLDCFIR
jgi:hypothetical protein